MAWTGEQGPALRSRDLDFLGGIPIGVRPRALEKGGSIESAKRVRVGCMGEVEPDRSTAFQLGGKRRKEGLHRESHSAIQAWRREAEREAWLEESLAGIVKYHRH